MGGFSSQITFAGYSSAWNSTLFKESDMMVTVAGKNTLARMC